MRQLIYQQINCLQNKRIRTKASVLQCSAPRLIIQTQALTFHPSPLCPANQQPLSYDVNLQANLKHMRQICAHGCALSRFNCNINYKEYLKCEFQSRFVCFLMSLTIQLLRRFTSWWQFQSCVCNPYQKKKKKSQWFRHRSYFSHKLKKSLLKNHWKFPRNKHVYLLSSGFYLYFFLVVGLYEELHGVFISLFQCFISVDLWAVVFGPLNGIQMAI